MIFDELVKRINDLNIDNKNEIVNIVNEIKIDENNFGDWVDRIFSDDVLAFDMGKLPYLIDELYQTDKRFKFLLCCMLLEATCDRLDFVTNLENYPLFEAKFKELIKTLVNVYEFVDNGIADCMALIVLNNDSKFTYFNDEQKERLTKATIGKLSGILAYLKRGDINPAVYDSLEVIVDLACYLNNQEINKLVDEIDKLGNNNKADIFIIKYKVINNLDILTDKINRLKNDNEYLSILYNVLEKLGVNDKYLGDVKQEDIAKSDMIDWLKYPTELNGEPDKIELLGEFQVENTRCYAFKFSKEDFSIKGDLIGIAGGYPIDKVGTVLKSYTFSKFENVSDDWMQQAIGIANHIIDYWNNKN